MKHANKPFADQVTLLLRRDSALHLYKIKQQVCRLKKRKVLLKSNKMINVALFNDIIKAHEGVQNVSNQAGKGTTFTIKLPK